MIRQVLCVGISLLLAASTTVFAQRADTKPPKRQVSSSETADPLAISGLASSGRHCIGPSGANTHNIGWVPSSSRVVITFVSDFDPVALALLTQLGSAAPDSRSRIASSYDDDSGGNLEPELRFTTAFPGSLVLQVSKFSAERSAGCYHYKVEVVSS